MSNKLHTNPFLFAVSMLTRVPLQTGVLQESAWRWVSASFATCGYLVGAVAAAPAILLPVANIAGNKYIPGFIMLPSYAINLLSALLFVLLSAWMTRLFHLDGFCDSCDAFAAVTDSKERRLEIMKDPHPGAVAVCMSSLLLLSKTILIFLVLQQASNGSNLKIYTLRTVPALLAISVFARFTMTALAAIGKYPREQGTGQMIINQTSTVSIIFGALTIAPLLWFIQLFTVGVVFLLIVITIFYWKYKADKLLGGVTGDILGACCETGECATAFGLLFIITT